MAEQEDLAAANILQRGPEESAARAAAADSFKATAVTAAGVEAPYSAMVAPAAPVVTPLACSATVAMAVKVVRALLEVQAVPVEPAATADFCSVPVEPPDRKVRRRGNSDPRMPGLVRSHDQSRWSFPPRVERRS